MADTAENVRIVLARCSKTGDLFAMRLTEVVSQEWLCDAAFAISEEEAEAKGYDAHQIKNLRGVFGNSDDYPGCPHCGNEGTMVCSCGRAGCHDGHTAFYDCQWCARRGQMYGFAQRLKTGQHRN